MSLEQVSFQAELEFRLREAGLPTNPRQIVGQLYQFGCEHGSHHHVLVGTVLAIEISDEGGLELHVSNPRFWGKKLISIIHSNSKWMVFVEIRPRKLSSKALERIPEMQHNRMAEDALRFFEGEFELL